MNKVSFLLKVKKHSILIVSLVSICLLITEANLVSFSLWLILPAWITLGICIAIRFSSIPNESPYKKAFYLLCLPLLFYFGFWETAFRDLLNLIFEPSFQHLLNFITNKPFLVLIILYLAFVCFFQSIELQKQRDSLERYKKQFMEQLHQDFTEKNIE
ncbi:MAG: hypothetical protein NTZ27_13255 [Ignavibacteriales bacterium]|nr:hypothetical protein [Ignavibacteriales bacterium]